jgi:hypothetical protein
MESAEPITLRQFLVRWSLSSDPVDLVEHEALVAELTPEERAELRQRVADLFDLPFDPSDQSGPS